ncbi:MAG: TIGR02253 family HAD-type hydrolase [Candidatus Undinarchaeales archaeon]
MIKWIFFDIDNTLYESKKLAEEARKNAVNAMISAGLPVQSVSETYTKLKQIIDEYGPNYSKHFDKLVEQFDVAEDKYDIIAAGVIAYHNTKFAMLKPSFEIINTLKELKKEYRLGIISNGRPVKQREKLIRLDLQDFFEVVVISEEIGTQKPKPKIFRTAVENAGCKPEEAVMIGDKESDMAAEKIGMHTINIKDLEDFEQIKTEVDDIE